MSVNLRNKDAPTEMLVPKGLHFCGGIAISL